MEQGDRPRVEFRPVLDVVDARLEGFEDALGALGVGGHEDVLAVRLVDDRGDLVGRHLQFPGLPDAPRVGDAARAGDLDQVDLSGQVATHCAARFLRAIEDLADLMGMAAGDREHGPGDEQARPQHPAVGDPLAQSDVEEQRVPQTRSVVTPERNACCALLSIDFDARRRPA